MIIIIIIVYKRKNKWNEAHSGWSTSTELLCSNTALKRCIIIMQKSGMFLIDIT